LLVEEAKLHATIIHSSLCLVGNEVGIIAKKDTFVSLLTTTLFPSLLEF